jgi:acyl-CoA thioester hydrolase
VIGDSVVTSDPERETRVLHRRVEHSDVDGYGVVHFPRYAAFMEAAMLEDLDARSLSLDRLADYELELRVRELNVKYLAPARHRDWLRLEPRLIHVGVASLRIEVKISRADREAGLIDLAVGVLSLAFVSTVSHRPVTLPDALARLLKEAS